MQNKIAVPMRLDDYRPYPFEVETVALNFELGLQSTKVTSRLKFIRKAETNANEPVFLNGDGLELTGLKIDGNKADKSVFQVQPDGLLVSTTLNSFVLEIETEVDPVANSALSGLYKSGGNWCTQCEAEGFRRITFYPDRPDVMSVFTVRLEAEKSLAPVLLSNGNLVETGNTKDGRHFAIWQDPWPKPAYLFALVAGDLSLSSDHFETASGRSVVLGIYTEHGKQHLTSYAMDALKRSMRWDEEKYGCEYDLDVFNIVAVSDFNMGAMENKGLNLFNDRYVLADPETATDADYANIEAIIAHEYFHNWTGNRITCRDWFQLCLKEGLTVFRDHEFSADMRSKPVKRIAEIRLLQAQQYPEDNGPLAHSVRPTEYVEINNFYTATVYEKGSEVVRMLQTILGEVNFRLGLETYLARHDGEAATVEQFIKCFEDVAKIDLSQFFLWYQQAGTPAIAVKTIYDDSKQTFTVHLQQSLNETPGQSVKLPMHIPVAFGLVGSNGDDLAYAGVAGGDVSNGVIHLKEAEQTFVFSAIGSKPVLSTLRGLSAPVKRTGTRASADLLFLAKHDSDLVSRWQALNELELSALALSSRSVQNGDAPASTHLIVSLKAEMAANVKLDPHYRALVLAVPTEGEIAREMVENVDVNTVYAARENWLKTLAIAVRNTSPKSMELRPHGAFLPDAKQAGARALANAILEMECIANNDPSLAFAIYQSAGNMTDRLAALNILAMHFSQSSIAAEALADFRQRFDGNALVLDKWLMITASMPGESALSRVRSAMADRAYDAGNPNRVRSLLGTFAMSNPTGFHRMDGLAYDFFAEEIIALDARNPQVAARVMTSLRSWRALEAQTREKLRATIAKIAGNSAISRDLADIAGRTLG